MPFPIVKICPGEFESFLCKHKDVATLWTVDTNEQFAEVSWPSPCTIDELMTEIERHSAGNDFIYIYNECIDDPEGEWARTDYAAVPEVKAIDMGDYIITCSMGKDWLSFACSPEEGWSDRRITLLPAGFEDGESEEEDDLSVYEDW